MFKSEWISLSYTKALIADLEQEVKALQDDWINARLYEEKINWMAIGKAQALSDLIDRIKTKPLEEKEE